MRIYTSNAILMFFRGCSDWNEKQFIDYQKFWDSKYAEIFLKQTIKNLE